VDALGERATADLARGLASFNDVIDEAVEASSRRD
jgi:hypothetical protein